MNYIEVTVITENEEVQELLISQLVELGFEGFQQENDRLIAIINSDSFDDKQLINALSSFQLSFEKKIIAEQNWNALWESNFNPITINNFVGVRAAFHAPIQNVQHEIIITPKMSFGTGHHATTYSVMQLMQHINFKNKTVFDFGTGTGILAILAEKLGSKEILAVDYDDWCIENATENLINNQCNKIEVIKANTAHVSKQFDIVIANINKNIIQDNFQNLHLSAKQNAIILLSGLLITDEEDILQLAKTVSWKHQQTITRGDWIAIEFQKV